jgi:hypothetical protein
MKKILVLAPLVAMVAACGTTDPYGKRAEQERSRQAEYVQRTIDKAPDWMIKVPTSTNAVYENGTAVSNDFSMADAKAMTMAYGKICMTAGGTASQQTKSYRTDSETTSTEMSEMAVKSSCASVDLTGVEVKEIKRIAEGTRYRTYVLIALPTGDANILRRAKEAQKQREFASARAPEAFKEMEKN